MRVMTICTDRGIFIAGGYCFLMNTIQYFLVLFRMTFLAGGVHLERKIAWTAGIDYGVRKTGDIAMAIHTSHIFLPVD